MDGDLRIKEASSLIIDGDVTFTGSGACIQGEWDPPYDRPFARLEGATPTSKLTIQPPAGNDNSDPLTSVVIREAWFIDVELVNNAYVIADIGVNLGSAGQGALVLQGSAKSGSGFWKAIKRPAGTAIGRLVVATEVVLPGPDWQIGGSGALWSTEGLCALIQIDPGGSFTGLTGDIVINDGVVAINTADLQLAPLTELRMSGGQVLINVDDFQLTGDVVLTGGNVTFDGDFSTAAHLISSGPGRVVVQPGHLVKFHVSP